LTLLCPVGILGSVCLAERFGRRTCPVMSGKRRKIPFKTVVMGILGSLNKNKTEVRKTLPDNKI